MACRTLSKEASIGNAGNAIKWTIRPMRKEDVDKTLMIWSKVELTEARQTVLSTLAADPQGFYVAELEETGEVIGMCAGPMTRADTAFMGFYAVEPEWQGIGIGRELWVHTLGRLGPETNVGLYGVPSMSAKYKKSGFIIEDTTRMLIFESKPHAGRELNLSALKQLDEVSLGGDGEQAGQVGQCRLEVLNGSEQSESLLRKIIDYDHSVQRFSRENLLRLYLLGDDVPLTLAIVRRPLSAAAAAAAASGQTAAAAAAAAELRSSCCAKPSQECIVEDETLSNTAKSSLSLASSCKQPNPISSSPIDIPSTIVSQLPQATTTSDGDGNDECSASIEEPIEVLGYGCIRHDNNEGGMIGPIYADSSELCEVLLRNLIARFELKSGQIYSVMALSSNKQACRILTKLGLVETEQCSRMFTKFVPAASFSKIYSVHSPNFTLF